MSTRRGRVGDGLDVGALFARHRDPLLVWFVRRTAHVELALDLWAETFACAVAGRKRFRGSTEEAAAAWLYGIARRQLALYLRRGKAEQRALNRLGLHPPTADEGFVAEIERRASLAELRANLDLVLSDLSGPVRDAVDLRVVQELSFDEVAARLGISNQAARARVSRGLLALADALDARSLSEEKVA